MKHFNFLKQEPRKQLSPIFKTVSSHISRSSEMASLNIRKANNFLVFCQKLRDSHRWNENDLDPLSVRQITNSAHPTKLCGKERKNMDYSNCCHAEMPVKNGEFVCSSCGKKYYVCSRLPKLTKDHSSETQQNEKDEP